MKNVLIYSVTNPDMAFCIALEDQYYEEGKELTIEGYNAWWSGEESDNISAKEAQDIYDSYCYGDAGCYLLDKKGIPYTWLDWLDENGELLPEYENEDIEYIAP